MAVVPTTTYLYCDADLNQFYVQGTALNDQGPWSSSASYAYPDVVQIGQDQYIAIAANSNSPPTGIVDENWSQLVVVGEGAVIPTAGSDYVARLMGSEALALGSAAYDLAATGSNVAWAAWEMAQNGTNLISIEAGSRIAADAILLDLIGSIAFVGSISLSAEQGTRSQADQVLTTALITEQGTRSQEDQVLQTQITVLSAALTTEQGTRSQEDQNLQNQIVTEQGTRSQEDQALATAISVETGSRIAADAAIVAFVFGSIATDLAAETGSRVAADTDLQTQIFLETGSRIQAINAEAGFRAAADVAEGSARFAADQQEIFNRTAADAALQTQITVEVSARIAGDAYLLTLIGTTSGSFSGSIVDLSGSLTAEAGTRSQEDQFLQTQITTEAGTRSSADQVLTTAIATEQGTRSSAIQVLTTAITVEQGTRSSADQVLTTAIATEQGTRSSAVQNLQNQITTEQGTRSSADQVLLTLINQEQANRIAVDNQIYYTTISGSNTANAAYSIAQTGTTTATAALTLAQSMNLILGAGTAGTNTFYVAQVPNSDRADLKITVVAGVLTGVVGSRYAWEDYEKYLPSTVGQGTGDLGLSTSWTGTGVIYTNDILLAFYGSDAMQSYAVGTVTYAPNQLTGGSHWGTNGGSILPSYIGNAGSDNFNNYNTGSNVAGSSINGGGGWQTFATLIAY